MNVLMALIMIISNVIKTTGDCPRSCECKWKSGKESVVCVNMNITEIPKQLDSGTQVLDLTGNKLQKIGADEFFNASLLNLQKIYLSRCRLRFIDRCSFRKIINLVELDLSYNELHSVPSHTFEFIGELRDLKLNGNPIIRVLNGAFKMVPRLTKLDLSECRIGYVEIRAFQGLENSLEWLKLDKNKITNIKPQALINLKNLHGLELMGNTWNCSCELRTLREWMLKQNVPYSIPPICNYPSRLVGKLWDKLELDEFACTPRIEAVTSQKNGEEGSNVTMSCSINGVPEPSIRWLRRNHVIANLSGALSSNKQKIYIVQITKQTSSLTILAADVQDNGVYICRAENKAGKSEANITLTVTVKPMVKVWSPRMIMAVGVVSLLFATAAGLLMYCAWDLRKRKPYFRNSVTRRELIDGYEMNQKKSINYNKIVDYGNLCSSATDICNTPGQNSRNEEYKSRTADISTTDDSDLSSFPSTQKSSKRSESTWHSLKVSDTQMRLNDFISSKLSPTNSHSLLSKGRNESSSSIGNEETCFEDFPVKHKISSSSFINKEALVLRPEKTCSSTTYYTSAHPETPKKFPDLLELSRDEENLMNNNSFNSMPRKRGCKTIKIRQASFGSESQSPLLPGSSGDSCDSNYFSSRRTSIEKNASFPTSPINPCQTPILNLLGSSQDIFAQSPTTLKYKSWELETFLKEYRNLQDQLYKMKESCENLNEDNLKFRTGKNSSKTVESVTISKLISPVYPEENFYELNKKFLDEANNFGSLYANREFLEEDNNNPKSILRNKSFEKTHVFNKNEEYWSSGHQYLRTLSESNSGKSFYQS